MLRKVISVLTVVTCILLNTQIVRAEETHDVPSNNGVKTYMDYRAITSKSSPQYKLQQVAVTSPLGVRTVDNFYCVAIGTGYGAKVGDRVTVRLDTGKYIDCIVGDIKANIHTDSTNKLGISGDAVEFIVDTDALYSYARKRGDMNVIDIFNGSVKSITVYNEDDVIIPETTNTYIVTGKDLYVLPFGNVIYTLTYDDSGEYKKLAVPYEKFEEAVIGFSTVSIPTT